MSSHTQALGQWAKAPLAMVLAQVRFSPGPELGHENVSAKMWERLIEQFPNRLPVQQFSWVLGNAEPSLLSPQVVGYDLRSEDLRKSIRVDDQVLTYCTSVYQNSGVFLNEWSSILEILCSLGTVKVSRLGVRYVDFIIPSEGKHPEDYLNGGLGQSPHLLGSQAPIAHHMYEYERDNGGRIRLQYSRGFGPPALPADLTEAVPPPPFLVSRYSGGESAVLDMDSWRICDESMDCNLLVSKFHEIRADMADVFKLIISDSALQEWQSTNSEE